MGRKIDPKGKVATSKELKVIEQTFMLDRLAEASRKINYWANRTGDYAKERYDLAVREQKYLLEKYGEDEK